MTMTDLDTIRQRLDASKGDLRRIAEATGVGYYTILRIKDGEGDPGFSKVDALKRYFASRRRRPVANPGEVS